MRLVYIYILVHKWLFVMKYQSVQTKMALFSTWWNFNPSRNEWTVYLFLVYQFLLCIFSSVLFSSENISGLLFNFCRCTFFPICIFSGVLCCLFLCTYAITGDYLYGSDLRQSHFQTCQKPHIFIKSISN